MKKLVAMAVTTTALVVAAPASADPGNGNGKGCGELFSALAAPGFGQAVSEVAREGGFSDTVALMCRGELP
jgi:hypothetical protein